MIDSHVWKLLIEYRTNPAFSRSVFNSMAAMSTRRPSPFDQAVIPFPISLYVSFIISRARRSNSALSSSVGSSLMLRSPATRRDTLQQRKIVRNDRWRAIHRFHNLPRKSSAHMEPHGSQAGAPSRCVPPLTNTSLGNRHPLGRRGEEKNSRRPEQLGAGGSTGSPGEGVTPPPLPACPAWRDRAAQHA